MNPNKVKQLESYKIYRELVSAVVEHVLLGISIDSYDTVNEKLKENHHISTDDIFDHPESLKSVLCNLYSSQYDEIFEKIKHVFGSSLTQYPISDFVNALENNHKIHNLS